MAKRNLQSLPTTRVQEDKVPQSKTAREALESLVQAQREQRAANDAVLDAMVRQRPELPMRPVG